MKRIDSVNARPNLNGAGKNGFHDNNDISGQDATYLTPEWLNDLQEELCNLLEKNGTALNPDQKDQIYQLLATDKDLTDLATAVQQSLDRKYDKTGGVVSGDLHLNGIFKVNADSTNGALTIRPNTLTKGTETQITLLSGSQIECYYLDKPVRAPTQVGGQWVTLTGDQSIGSGQTWQDVTGSRAKATTYTNTSGRPKFINIVVGGNDGDGDAELFINGIKVGIFHCGYGTRGSVTISAIVPAEATYRLNSGSYISIWAELI